jgi:hypothetical protein
VLSNSTRRTDPDVHKLDEIKSGTQNTGSSWMTNGRAVRHFETTLLGPNFGDRSMKYLSENGIVHFEYISMSAAKYTCGVSVRRRFGVAIE